jgi:uncharacterized membrane protein
MTSTPAAPTAGPPSTSTPPSSTPSSTPDATTPTVALAQQIEGLSALDPAVRAVRPLADKLVEDPQRAQLLRGTWLGHALHPILTDVPIGFWTSAVVLDLVGGRGARGPARRLIGLGVVAAVPTAVTGWAEWSGTGQREQRVGVVHAASNVLALSLFTASWRARRAERHLRGVALGLAASSALGVGGFLGGHLVGARKVSSRNPRFED